MISGEFLLLLSIICLTITTAAYSTLVYQPFNASALSWNIGGSVFCTLLFSYLAKYYIKNHTLIASLISICLLINVGTSVSLLSMRGEKINKTKLKLARISLISSSAGLAGCLLLWLYIFIAKRGKVYDKCMTSCSSR